MADRRSERIGIRDVAAEAGVSVTTVSHALSGKGRISEETRQSITKIASDLGYRPNATARNLVSGKTGLLGIAVSASPGAPFGLGDFDYFIQLLSAATGAAVASGNALVVEGSARNADAFDRVDIDGAIVVDPVSHDPLLGNLESRGIPIVTTGRRSDDDDAADRPRYWIDNDHAAATVSILDHLKASGAERIALLSSPPVTSYALDASSGYRSWCESHGQDPLIAVADGPINEGSGLRAARTLLDSPSPPDAIYATLDQLALGVLLAAQERSLSVPGQLMVAGCTDSHASAFASPPLTAVQLNPETIGRLAVETLVSLVEGEKPPENPILVPTDIRARESTARFK